MSKFHSHMGRNSQSHETLACLTTCAMMVALSVVLCRLLGFPQSGAMRVEIGFLPIAIVAYLYGPAWSATAYGLADFIGAAIFTGVNPFITLCKIAFGFAMGLCFYRKEKIGLARNIAFFTVVAVIVDIGLMTPIFIYMFGYELWSAITYRSIGAFFNTPVRILGLAVAEHYLFPAFKKLYFTRYQAGGDINE